MASAREASMKLEDFALGKPLGQGIFGAWGLALARRQALTQVTQVPHLASTLALLSQAESGKPSTLLQAKWSC